MQQLLIERTVGMLLASPDVPRARDFVAVRGALVAAPHLWVMLTAAEFLELAGGGTMQ